MRTAFFASAILLLATSPLFSSCKKHKEDTSNDFDQIISKKELVIITMNTSLSYFLYKNEPMGYDYELSREFCEHHGLELKVKIAENTTRLIEMLENGEGDLIAYPVSIQNHLKEDLIYCGPDQVTHQVLVQRNNSPLVKDVTELIGKEVYVKDKTKYHQRLLNLNTELGEGILIKDIEKDTISSEDLIEMVSLGKIDYTVSDDDIARLNKTYYKNIDVSLPISFDQRSAWLVRKNSPKLAEELNKWAGENEYKRVVKSMTKKYFELSKLPFDGEYIIPANLKKGQLSPFDDLFKKHAEGTQFDWHILAAIAYQESRFRTDLTSWAGATGLMGIMPRTALSLGITLEDRKNPDLSIMASVKMLKNIDRMYSKVPKQEDRLKMTLASYNGGIGHISDAQALAKKHGEDPYSWKSVEKYLKLKSIPEYYNDPVCKSGYFRGAETQQYVIQVSSNWEKFKKNYQ